MKLPLLTACSLLLCLLFQGLPAAGQSNVPVDTAGITTEFPEVMPEFPGGENGLRQYLRNKLEHSSVMRKYKGTITIISVVEKNGELNHIAVFRGLHPEADHIALNIVRSMPRWKPGLVSGKPVRTLLRVLVPFEGP